MRDPTYDPAEIAKNPEWDIVFVLSECLNDAAPLGWSKYDWVVKALLKQFDITRKEQ